jgi:heme/copper-type cytochrome/quinol oxidase subunit 2
LKLPTIVAILAVASVPLQAEANGRPKHPAPQEVTIRMNEYQFEPGYVEVQRHIPVELRLVNSGKVLHEFVSDVATDVTVDIETQGSVAVVRGLEELEIMPGSTVVLRFTPKRAGRFSFRCDAEQPVSHHDAGMKGTLVVR